MGNNIKKFFIQTVMRCISYKFALLLVITINLAHAGGTDEVDTSKTPFEIVEGTPKGKIISPYDPADELTAKAGHKVYMETGCSGCHGGTGGGGMGPPLSNQKWVYGDDTDTLFRLITLGTQQLHERGYSRIATERVRAPMPAQASGPIVIETLTTDRLLQIITWIQSLHVEKEK